MNLDVRRALRGVVDLGRLVRHVLTTSANNETDWLEWKSAVDLMAPAGRFAVAKQVLGFSNRNPDRAAVHVEGCGYLVLGAEPGILHGQAPMDPADLEAALRRYVGEDGPAWSPVWITTGGVEVLVITVEPPRWGDPIRTLRKAFDNFEDGAVFVRRPGGCHRASTDEMQMLQTRFSRQSEWPPLGISVEVLSGPLPVLDVEDGYISRWLDSERERLLSPLSELNRPTVQDIEKDLDQLPANRASLIRSAFVQHQSEQRSREEFRTSVEEYMEECRKVFPAVAGAAFVKQTRAVLAVALRNPTAKNVPAVELELRLSGPVFSFDEDLADIELPEAPRAWGASKVLNFGFDPSLLAGLPRGLEPRFTMPRYPHPSRGYSSENIGSTLIRYEPIDLRPHGTSPLEHVPLLVRADVGEFVYGIGAQRLQVSTGSWRARSQSRRRLQSRSKNYCRMLKRRWNRSL